MKQQILQRYKEMLQDRIDVFQDMISGLTVDAQNDAKGSREINMKQRFR